jgi:predicted kinase
MKYMYRGNIYESVYSAATSPFNLSILNRLHTISEAIAEHVEELMSSPYGEINVAYPAWENPAISVMSVEASTVNGSNATVQKLPKGGYLIRLNTSNTRQRYVNDDMFMDIMHEVAHIFQMEAGIFSEAGYYKPDGKIDFKKYFNDPTEINAFLLSLIGKITYSKQELEKYKSMSFNSFYKNVVGMLGEPTVISLENHLNKAKNGMADNFVSTMRIIHKRILAGFFENKGKNSLTEGTSNGILNGKEVNMNKLILVRGASGSGKSTFAKKIAGEIGADVFETDQYFIRNGEYRFDPTKLGAAHAWNQKRTEAALREGKTVVVPNTFTQLWEINQYLKIAEAVGVPVEVYRSNAKFQNVHGVPEEKVQQMRDRMVDFPGEKIINN